jgi:hypothetical protein
MGHAGEHRSLPGNSWPGDGHRYRIIERAEARYTAIAGDVPAEPAGTVQVPGCRRLQLPQRPSSYAGITLSDEEGPS